VKKNQLIGIIVSILVLTGCSGSNTSTPSSGASSNGITTALTTLNSKIDAVSGLLDTARSASGQTAQVSSKDVSILATSFGAAWTTTTPGFPNYYINGSPDVPAKDFMGGQLDDEGQNDGGAAINAFGRMKNAFDIFCAIGVGATAAGQTVDSSGYIDNGTYTITFSASVKAAMTSTCGIDTSNIPDDTAMMMTVESGGTNYDKKISFDVFDQTYWVKNDATVLRIATSENQEFDSGHSGADAFSRTLAEYNKTTGITRVQYTSLPDIASSGLEFFRLYYNENTDEGMVIAYKGTNTGVTNAIRYVLAGKPSTGDAFSLSLRADNQFGSATSRNACVLAANGNITTDGSLCTASSTRLAGADVTAADATMAAVYGSTASGWGVSGLTDADVLPFTDMTDILTATATQ
jgi:outer membrane murein-binding lipoprotein Lpp